MFEVNEEIDDIINDLNDKYNESVYDKIYDELCYRVEEGELSLEDAEIINEAAYDRYITEAGFGTTVAIGAAAGLIIGLIEGLFERHKEEKIYNIFKDDPEYMINKYEATHKDLYKISETKVKKTNINEIIKTSKKLNINEDLITKLKHKLVDYPNENSIDIYFYKDLPVAVFLYDDKKFKEYTKGNIYTIPGYSALTAYGHYEYYAIDFITRHLGKENIVKLLRKDQLMKLSK